MILTNIAGEVIAIILIVIIILAAVLYIIKKKKSGAKCIGCPYSKTCNTKNLKTLCCEELKRQKEENE